MQLATFHLIWNTYGSWVPGDPRGFRSRNHKIHSRNTVERPEAVREHRGLYRTSAHLLARAPVLLDESDRETCLAAIVEKLAALGWHGICFAVGATHVHGLAMLPVETVRAEVGKLKRHAAIRLRQRHPGGCWSDGCHLLTCDPDHAADTFRYILHHASKEAAAVWHRTGDAPPPRR